MGRSTSSSCFKILACDGGESGDDEDLDPAVSKTSSDKRRWSFRKRSARHQVLSSIVISEPVPVGYDKDNPEANANNYPSPKILSVPEKAPVEEAAVNSEVVEPLVTERDTTPTNHNLEYSVVIIQAAIRGYSAQMELRRLKNVVKLQAAVRGHLVRRQAVGSLRCVRAIVKLQALIRARHARRFAEQSAAKNDEKLRIDTKRPVNLGNGVCFIKSNKTHPSMEKLLSCRFACQLLESTSKTRRIHIKCDPLRSDSTWKWLEMWMAVTSKFDELSSTTTVHQGAFSESKPESHESYQVNSSTKTKDLSVAENSITHDPRVQTATSESEAESGELVLEFGALEKGYYVINGGADSTSELSNMNAEAKNSFDVEVLKTQKLDEGDGNLVDLITTADALQVEQQPEEATTSDIQTQNENLIYPQVYRSSSPEGTPRSHATAPESHGTPSSQVSTNAKKGKNDNKIPTRKQRSRLVSKRSPSNPNKYSDGRSSTENLSKDSNTGGRRNSLGTAKPDHVDHEPRTSSSNSLPSYMQATESAKAKALAGISPKSSPDVHEKDHYMRKRHSLPIGNGKQGSSPRMQRSASQAQQNSKANGANSPHDSAERRWQR